MARPNIRSFDACKDPTTSTPRLACPPSPTNEPAEDVRPAPNPGVCVRAVRPVRAGLAISPPRRHQSEDYEPERGLGMACWVDTDGDVVSLSCLASSMPAGVYPCGVCWTTRADCDAYRDTSNFPPVSQITNIMGKVILGQDANNSLNLDFSGFPFFREKAVTPGERACPADHIGNME